MKPGGTSRFIGFCAVLAAVSLLPGCGPTTSRKGIVAYDFIESFPLSAKTCFDDVNPSHS